MSPKYPGSRGRFVYDIGDLDADQVDPSEAREVLADRAPDGVRRRSYDKAFGPKFWSSRPLVRPKAC